MPGQVFIANAARAAWIPAPLTDMAAGASGVSEVLQLSNGGAYVAKSTASRRQFDMQWMGASSDLQVIKDFVSNDYGVGTLYWLDPFVADRNVLPPHWAAPGLAANGDYRPMVGGVSTTVSFNTNFTSAVNAPGMFMSVSRVANTALMSNKFNQVFIPLPAGYTLDVGWRGSSTNLNLVVTQVNSSTDSSFQQIFPVATTTIATVTPVAATSGFNYTTSVSSASVTSSASLVCLTWIVPTAASASTASIYSLDARVRPTTSVLSTAGNHVSGSGTMGLQAVTSYVDETYVTAGSDLAGVTRRQGMAVSLVEVNV